MSNDSTRKREEERNERERGAQRRSTAEYATCLHCGNPFLISEGVVTSDAALCDICNGD